LSAVVHAEVAAGNVGDGTKLALWAQVTICVAVRDLLALGQRRQLLVGLRDRLQQLQGSLAGTTACVLELIVRERQCRRRATLAETIHPKAA
jgi:hypothetical protein